MSIVVPGITHCEKHMKPISLGRQCAECEEEKRKSEIDNVILKRMIPKYKLIHILQTEVIDISGFKCIPAECIEELLKEE